MAAKNAADNNNVGFGMPMDLGQNMGADTATGMVSAFGNETSTGDIYNVGEENGHEDSAFCHHITQHPWARLNVSSTTVASGNLYTTDLNNSFYGELPMGGQCLKYRCLMPISACVPDSSNGRRRNETHMVLCNTPSVQSMSEDNSATITTMARTQPPNSCNNSLPTSSRTESIARISQWIPGVGSLRPSGGERETIGW